MFMASSVGFNFTCPGPGPLVRPGLGPLGQPRTPWSGAVSEREEAHDDGAGARGCRYVGRIASSFVSGQEGEKARDGVLAKVAFE